MSIDWYPREQFVFFRVCLGLFIIWQLEKVLPYSHELYSSIGVLPKADELPNIGWWLSPLSHFDQPETVHTFIRGVQILALLFTLGLCRRLVAFLLWLGWFSLITRNQYTGHVGVGYVNWLLLACCLIPPGEGFNLFGKKDDRWTMPPLIFWGAVFVWSFLFTFSGLQKWLSTPEWRNGTALTILVNKHMYHASAVTLILKQILPFGSKFISWMALGAEIFCLPMVFFSKGRIAIWIIWAGICPVLLATLQIPGVILSLMIFQLFIFDWRWIGSSAL